MATTMLQQGAEDKVLIATLHAAWMQATGTPLGEEQQGALEGVLNQFTVASASTGISKSLAAWKHLTRLAETYNSMFVLPNLPRAR